MGQGASRLKRSYHWGTARVNEAKYEPVPFSDHLSHVVSLNIPAPLSRMLSPKSRTLFKIRPEIIRDKVFQERLSDSMLDWQEVNYLGLDILSWWEIMVKPGIKKLAIQRSKELNREKRGELNLLLLRQAYLIRQLQKGQLLFLGELRAVQADITSW